MKKYAYNSIKRKLELWNEKFNVKVKLKEWISWEWQFKNAIKKIDFLERFIPLNEERKAEIIKVLDNFIMSITPHYLTNVALLLLDGKENEAKSLMKSFIPSIYELQTKTDLLVKDYNVSKTDIDGLGEDGTTPFSYMSQLYKDRILLFVTHLCPFYCRYCFRRRKVIIGPDEEPPENIFANGNLDKVIDFIRKNKEIRDVIISGGEPLFLSDEKIEKILKLIREIKHVKIIRIDTKIPVIAPMRITKELIKILKKYHPLFMTLHFIHPSEITPETKNACEMLADAGIPLGTYTPILKDINDNREVLKNLFWELVQIRVRPYYLVQFVPTIWTEHFRVPLEESLKLIDGIHGELSGIAIPSFKVYVPGKGKVPLLPNYYIKKTQEGHLLRTKDGDIEIYKE
jgi:lysine 2,3-aminomutase